MRQWIIITLAVFTFSSLALAQSDSKAEQIMHQARAAISNETQTKTLKTLSVAMTIHRTIGETHLERDIDYDIMLPDTFRRHESQQPFTTVTSMLDDSYQTYNVPNPAARAGDVLRENSNDPQAVIRRRADFTRVLLGLLLISPSSEPVEYSYAGEFKEPDTLADMIDVKGKDGFKVRLYIDQKTKRLLMLTYHSKQLSHAVRSLARQTQPRPNAPQDNKKLTEEQVAKRQVEQWAEIEKRRKMFEEALAQAPEVEYRWEFSEYKNIKGMNFPYHVVKSEANHEYEEWDISAFRINPKLQPAKVK